MAGVPGEPTTAQVAWVVPAVAAVVVVATGNHTVLVSRPPAGGWRRTAIGGRT